MFDPSKFKAPAFVATVPENKVVSKTIIKRVSLEGVVGSRVDRRDYRGNGHWDFPTDMGVSNAIGFIYVIRNNITGRAYIGKKFYKGTGKLNKGQSTNWAWYISSSKELSEDVKTLGKENFSFFCIEEYATKGSLSWAETWSICHVRAPEFQDKWYNLLINKVSWKVKAGITQRHLTRLGEF